MTVIGLLASIVPLGGASIPPPNLCPGDDPGSYINYCVKVNAQQLTVTVPDPDTNFDYTVEICVAPPAPCVYVPTVPNILANLQETRDITATVYNTKGTYARVNSGELVADVCEIATGDRNCLAPTAIIYLADLDGDGMTDTLAYGEDEDDANLLALPSAM